VVKILPRTVAHRVSLLAAVLCLVYAAIVFVGSWIYVGKMYDSGILAQDIPIQQWIPRLVMPVGFALLFLRFAEVLYNMVKGKDAHLLGDEVKDALRYRSDAEPPSQEKK